MRDSTQKPRDDQFSNGLKYRRVTSTEKEKFRKEGNILSVLFVIARILFSIIFIMSGIGHMTKTSQMGEYAKSKNVPFPNAAVFFTGVMIFLGGISVLLGLWVEIGAWLLIIFLIPAAFIIHNFWTVEDPMQRQNEQIHFLKDLGLAGGAFFIWYLYIMLPNLPLSLS